MSIQFEDIARSIAADGVISSTDVLALRRTGWSRGEISPSQAEAIFALNDALEERPGEWADFFVEAIGDFVLNTLDPKGHITDEHARWLIERVSASGHVESMAEMDLLVRLVERAETAPEVLKSFILEAMEREILTGTGPTRCGGELTDHFVTVAECSILRRVIFAPASDRPAAVSEREADMLFRIKQATVHCPDNAPEWKTLFVQGVANYLKGFSPAKHVLSYKRAAELDRFMSDHSSDTGAFLGKMARHAPNSLGVVFGKRQSAPQKPDHAAIIKQAGVISAAEQLWLDAHLNADGSRDEYDLALLAFLAEEQG
ncbi:hypothetical protein GRI39_10285 [Altererythrobacter indicus]|uniref:Uncharacterized protein n=1 Tax=Altericroceibacterium indicum TaxID=374177 RepID=A0A845ACE4_9SPHN|nr:hypothetical protein [Altericroceibacterium indicum]MXP26425.1 hypothetical protein [Altericroceibacterium indicum]